MDSIETLFTIKPDAQAEGYPIDALDCAITRAEAIVVLLISEFCCTGKSCRLSDTIVGNALSAVSGHLAMIKTMVEYWHDVEVKREAKP